MERARVRRARLAAEHALCLTSAYQPSRTRAHKSYGVPALCVSHPYGPAVEGVGGGGCVVVVVVEACGWNAAMMTSAWAS